MKWIIKAQIQYAWHEDLQFAFGGGDNLYLPHNVEANSVVYTGTHDNDTTGCYQQLENMNHLHSVLNSDRPDIPICLIDVSVGDSNRLLDYPMQDVWHDSTNRIDPSTVGGSGFGVLIIELTLEQQQHFADAVLRSGRRC
jgi:4-alpha-glucanotransferase